MSESEKTVVHSILIESIDKDRQRLSEEITAQRYLLRTILGLGSFLIVGLGAAAVYLIGNSISELKSDVLALADSRVQAAISNSKDRVDAIEDILGRIREAEDDYNKYSIAIDSLSGLANLEALGTKDPYGSYKKLELLDNRSRTNDQILSDEERATALRLIESILEASTLGLAEPNIIFNTAVSASRLEFNSEAVKLAVLAEYWHPSLSHRVIRVEYSTLYGKEFVFDGKKLAPVDKPASEVREEAWQNMKSILRTVPRHECEQAYSRASNVAVRNRSNSYYTELIDLIESSLEAGQAPTSYAIATLAKLYTWEGAPNWEDKYFESVKLSLEILSAESPRSSWYKHSAQDILKNAYRIGRVEEVLGLAEAIGIRKSVWEEAVKGLSQDAQDIDI